MPHLSDPVNFAIKNIKQLCQIFHFAREARNPVKTNKNLIIFKCSQAVILKKNAG